MDITRRACPFVRFCAMKTICTVCKPIVFTIDNEPIVTGVAVVVLDAVLVVIFPQPLASTLSKNSVVIKVFPSLYFIFRPRYPVV